MPVKEKTMQPITHKSTNPEQLTPKELNASLIEYRYWFDPKEKESEDHE